MGPQGDKGDPGIQGPAGFASVKVRTGIPANLTSQAYCQGGELAVGGGATVSGDVLIESVPLLGLTPASDNDIPNGWQASSTGSGTVTAYVLCAAASNLQ
jgi:hypothetical protein